MSRLKLKQIQEFLISGTIGNGDFLAYNSSTGQWEDNDAPLDGAKGDTGQKGQKGAQGDQGAQGGDGAQGAQGGGGAQGAKGTTG